MICYSQTSVSDFPCGGLSWLPVSFLLHVKYTVSYCIVNTLERYHFRLARINKEIQKFLVDITKCWYRMFRVWFLLNSTAVRTARKDADKYIVFASTFCNFTNISLGISVEPEYWISQTRAVIRVDFYAVHFSIQFIFIFIFIFDTFTT